MSAPPMTRYGTLAQRVTLDDAVRHEIEALRQAGELVITEPRCYVCCEVESKDLVNKLIAAGGTNREITEACEGINRRRNEAGDDRIIQARNVWHHRREHFNVDKPAQAIYREIMERRAEEANIDSVNGVGHAIVPYALLEVALVKGYANMVDDATVVNVKEAMEAAVRLHEMTSKDASTRKMADLLYQMDRIVMAAQRFIPPEEHQAFLAAVEGRSPLAALTQRAQETAEAAIREFTPTAKMDEGDEL